MKTYLPEQIKNVVFLSHSGAGKTTTIETLLFNSGSIKRLGRVDDGTSQVDYLPFEIEKQITISSKVFPIETKEMKLNVIDTPGYADFFGEIVGALSVVDTGVLLIDAPSGVEVHSLKCWDLLRKYNTPSYIFINKLDKENASFENSIKSVEDQLNKKIIILQIPIGEGENFEGIVDLMEMKAYMSSGDEKKPAVAGPIPDSVKDMVEEYRIKMIEAIAETDESLMEKYFAEEELTPEEMFNALKISVKNSDVYPVLCGSAINNVGINTLLQTLIASAPASNTKEKFVMKNDDGKEIEMPISPEGKNVCRVFKTVVEEHIGEMLFVKVYSGKISSGMELLNQHNRNKEKVGQIISLVGKTRKEMSEVTAGDIAALVKLKNVSTGDTLTDTSIDANFDNIDFPEPVIALAVQPKAKKDQEKLSNGLSAFSQEDPTFKVEMNKEFGELIIRGMGELHLDIMIKRLKKKYNVDLDTAEPRISYRETLKKPGKAQGKYKKQSGGRGQYGDCHIRIEPQPRGTGFEFGNEIFGGSIPSKYVPAVEKGVKDALEKGFIAGYPMIDLKVIVYDGTYHDVDSSDLAFQIAGSFAIKKACEICKPVLLEPVVELVVKVPENYMGDVIGDLNSRRGKVSGMSTESGISTIKALVPQREVTRYATDLRSLTRGQGDFSCKFSTYEEAPHDIAQKIIQETKQAEED